MLSATEMSLVLKEAADLARAGQPELREQLIEVREAVQLLREENLQLRVRCAELRRRLQASEALNALRLQRSQLDRSPPQLESPPSLRPPLGPGNPAAGENEQAAVCPARPPLRRRRLGL
ncbi:MAG TPA: hypothetical protein VFY71_15470 [Planctomycetota bacterium]|nr:hypothetical protein [Planctomycetota bacterium]